MTQDENLISRLHELYSANDIDTKDFSVLDIIFAFGSPIEALMYSRLFWPDFVEIDDMVFLKETIEDDDDRQRLVEAFEEYGKDRRRTEQAFNLIEIPSDLFGRRAGETTEEEDYWLAELLAEMWRARLYLLYPNRRFLVEVLSSEDTGGEVGIIFYQK